MTDIFNCSIFVIFVKQAMAVKKEAAIIGDSSIGKTCLASVFFKNLFPEENPQSTSYISMFSTLFHIDQQVTNLILWDMNGSIGYNELSALKYVDLAVVIICYSLDAPMSLYNVSQKWAQNIQKLGKDVPIVLVGNKKDVRDQQENKINAIWKRALFSDQVERVPEPIMLSREQGLEVAKEIGAVAFFECSAKNKENVERVFLDAISAIMPTKKKKKCFGFWCF